MAEGFITRRGGGVNVKDATATENDVLQGETFYSVDKDIKTGNIPSKSAQTFTPTTSNQTIAANQFLSGIQTILGDGDLQAGNIKSGVNIFGVNGNFAGELPQRAQYWYGNEIVNFTASGQNTSSNITLNTQKLSDRFRVTAVRPSSGGSAGTTTGFVATIDLTNISFITADIAHYGSGNINSCGGQIAVLNGADAKTASFVASTGRVGYTNSFTNFNVFTAVLDVSSLSGNQFVAFFATGSSFGAFNHIMDFFNLRLTRFN